MKVKMGSFVVIKIVNTFKSFVTSFAHKRSFCCVNPHVITQTFCQYSYFAHIAIGKPFSKMGLYMIARVLFRQNVLSQMWHLKLTPWLFSWILIWFLRLNILSQSEHWNSRLFWCWDMWFLNNTLAALLLFHDFIGFPFSSNFLKLYSLPHMSHLYPKGLRSLDDPSFVLKVSIFNYYLHLNYWPYSPK